MQLSVPTTKEQGTIISSPVTGLCFKVQFQCFVQSLYSPYMQSIHQSKVGTVSTITPKCFGAAEHHISCYFALNKDQYVVY